MPLADLWKRRQLAIDYRHTFNTEPGRRVLWDLLTRCHIFQSSFKPGAPSEVTAFREGERNVGLQIMAMMQIEDVEKLQEYAQTEEDSGFGK